MTRKRSLEIWHIPKRGSLLQIIGALNILDKFEIDGKPWPATNRKLFDQKFAIWGFTSRGRSLSRNASETLEALIKYLGFIVIDIDRRIRITKSGRALLDEFPVIEPQKKKRKLSETEELMGDISSNIVKEQMIKLKLTNPSISTYCQNIAVSPFRETLRLLLDEEIGYLSSEEMAIFLFKMKGCREREEIKRKILKFRSMRDEEREKITNEYKRTPEGNITLTQAATSTYWRQLCRNTGLCIDSDKKLFIKNVKKEEAQKLLEKYEDRFYDFKEDLALWYEYFCYPERIKQPIDIQIKVRYGGDTEYLVVILHGDKLHRGSIVDEERIYNLPVFPDEQYTIQVIDLEKGDLIKEQKKKFESTNEILEISLKERGEIVLDKKFYCQKIINHIASQDFDTQYKRYLTIVGNYLGKFYLEKKNRGWLRGGRLEFLFKKILEKINDVEDLKWNGHIDNYGVMHAAPGLKKGSPDITFKCGDKYYILELTTITAASAQWGAEGSSVPFHIYNFVEHTGIANVIGIFCAPVIHDRVKDGIKNQLIPRKYKILCISIEELLNWILSDIPLRSNLEKLLKKEYPS
jgi:hypothetical protein